ncbi:hypothetical protein C8A00DRAFT_41824 [Chaetomidium leptoderma]|uniref:Uncharacterized protein n=1 Tax=Chaetomidium leptoderma TaxID=669021 RepID=A0AAN6VRK2_9PEZI|nr:hypothetical protein C8A00DRAFT_41824 [Chaetomidium leptoderma]
MLLGQHACPQLQIDVAYQRSVLMRLKGDIQGSARTIQDLLSRAPPATPAHILGPLHVSQAKNYAYKFRFSEAHGEAKKYAPTHLAEGQPDLLWDHIYGVGRILRGEGRFEEARQCFELCRNAPALAESRQLLIQSATADLYCELDYQQSQRHLSLLLIARDWLTVEVQALHPSSRSCSKGLRRVLLSLVEIQIRLGYYDEARLRVSQVLGIYDSLAAPDIVDRLGHVRALIASARISSLEDAEIVWSDALRWNKLYNPFEEDVFTCGVVYMYMCLVRHKLGNISGSRECLEKAQQVFKREKRQFLIPGVGTYLVDFVVNEVQTMTGCTCGV